MKRIIICCDGTWNTPDMASPTNVVRFAEAVDPVDALGVQQIIYYDTGVGTSGGWLRKRIDAITGRGLGRNLLEAYRFICLHYEPGDQLCFFGFSRGAFTVRSLTGLIRNSGILKSAHLDQEPQAYALYRSRTRSGHPRSREARLFRRTYSVSDITPIRIVGVWDTIGALGNPLLTNGWLSRRHAFHNNALSSTIEHAYHAVAIDETRKSYKPALWQRQPSNTSQTIEQVWFAGSHSDVGGGDASRGISDITFLWMANRAEHCGISLSYADIAQPCYVTAPITNSNQFPWYLLGKISRTIGTHAPDPHCLNEPDETVKMRYRTDPSYRPKNLLEFIKKRPLWLE